MRDLTWYKIIVLAVPNELFFNCVNARTKTFTMNKRRQSYIQLFRGENKYISMGKEKIRSLHFCYGINFTCTQWFRKLDSLYENIQYKASVVVKDQHQYYRKNAWLLLAIKYCLLKTSQFQDYCDVRGSVSRLFHFIFRCKSCRFDAKSDALSIKYFSLQTYRLISKDVKNLKTLLHSRHLERKKIGTFSIIKSFRITPNRK